MHLVEESCRLAKAAVRTAQVKVQIEPAFIAAGAENLPAYPHCATHATTDGHC